MPRDKLAKLQHELNTEPRRHRWDPVAIQITSDVRHCVRRDCGWTWLHGTPEPTGCTGTDPEGTE